MAEIGNTLREARIRQNLEIGAVEDATKIRAKYLRALEAEEFDVLPGPTYIKTFVKTYAEFLGLDAQLLLDEHRARFESRADAEIRAFNKTPKLKQHRIRAPGPPSGGAVVAIVLVAVLGFLIILGLTSNDSGPPQPRAVSTASVPTTTAQQVAAKKPPVAKKTRVSPLVKLVLKPRQAVWVCLIDSSGKVLVRSRTLQPGQNSGPFRAKSFKASLGNSGVDITANGQVIPIADNPNPVGYLITKGKLTPLPQGQRPTCK